MGWTPSTGTCLPAAGETFLSRPPSSCPPIPSAGSKPHRPHLHPPGSGISGDPPPRSCAAPLYLPVRTGRAGGPVPPGQGGADSTVSGRAQNRRRTGDAGRTSALQPWPKVPASCKTVFIQPARSRRPGLRPAKEESPCVLTLPSAARCGTATCTAFFHKVT